MRCQLANSILDLSNPLNHLLPNIIFSPLPPFSLVKVRPVQLAGQPQPRDILSRFLFLPSVLYISGPRSLNPAYCAYHCNYTETTHSFSSFRKLKKDGKSFPSAGQLPHLEITHGDGQSQTIAQAGQSTQSFVLSIQLLRRVGKDQILMTVECSLIKSPSFTTRVMIHQ